MKFLIENVANMLKNQLKGKIRNRTFFSSEDLKLKINKKDQVVQNNLNHGFTPTILFNCLQNNVHVAVSSEPGKLLFKLSSGTVGMKGASKTAPKAIPSLLDELKRLLIEKKVIIDPSSSGVRINFRGISPARAMIVSGLRRLGLRITEVFDSTGIPFNGCRPKKTRRL
jgi:small subunit ribosomal protein S11